MSNSVVIMNIHQFRSNAPTVAAFVGRSTLLGFTSSVRTNSLGHEVSEIASRRSVDLDFSDPSVHGQILFRDK